MLQSQFLHTILQAVPKVSTVIVALPVPAQNLQALILQDAHSRAAFSEASEWTRAAVNCTTVASAAVMEAEDIVGKEGGRADKNLNRQLQHKANYPICFMPTMIEGINGPIPGLSAKACTSVSDACATNST